MKKAFHQLHKFISHIVVVGYGVLKEGYLDHDLGRTVPVVETDPCGTGLFRPCLFCPSDNFETCLALLTRLGGRTFLLIFDL